MEENRETACEKRYPIYLTIQISIISTNRYFATYKTEH